MWHNQVRAGDLFFLLLPEVGSGVRWEEQGRLEVGGQTLLSAQGSGGYPQDGIAVHQEPHGRRGPAEKEAYVLFLLLCLFWH